MHYFLLEAHAGFFPEQRRTQPKRLLLEPFALALPQGCLEGALERQRGKSGQFLRVKTKPGAQLIHQNHARGCLLLLLSLQRYPSTPRACLLYLLGLKPFVTWDSLPSFPSVLPPPLALNSQLDAWEWTRQPPLSQSGLVSLQRCPGANCRTHSFSDSCTLWRAAKPASSSFTS